MIEEVYKVYKEIVFRAGFKRIYEVSNYGNVKINDVLVKPRMHIGYKMIGTFFIHRAVAELFIPNPDNKPCVDHIDTDRTNNHVSNLRWTTHKENMNNELTLLSRHHPSKPHKPHKHNPNTGKGILGKHRVYDDIEHNKYHYE